MVIQVQICKEDNLLTKSLHAFPFEKYSLQFVTLSFAALWLTMLQN